MLVLLPNLSWIHDYVQLALRNLRNLEWHTFFSGRHSQTKKIANYDKLKTTNGLDNSLPYLFPRLLSTSLVLCPNYPKPVKFNDTSLN